MAVDLDNRKKHWEKIYQTGSPTKRGWYQEHPGDSLNLIRSAGVPKTAEIIDIGGGDSLLVDHLLGQGHENITVLDVSEHAIQRAKKRLGERFDQVSWICTDITAFKTDKQYDLWHDRACLHFLTRESELELYKEKACKSIRQGGTMITATFSHSGPERCSGLPVRQFERKELFRVFQKNFDLLESFDAVHRTPSGTNQNYVFCSFKKITN